MTFFNSCENILVLCSTKKDPGFAHVILELVKLKIIVLLHTFFWTNVPWFKQLENIEFRTRQSLQTNIACFLLERVESSRPYS